MPALAQAPTGTATNGGTQSQQFVDARYYVPSVQRKQSDFTEERAQIKAWVLNRVQEEGLDPKVVDAIIVCESGYNPQAKHANGNGTWDIGIFQINDVHKLSIEDRIDYKKSTEFALTLMKSKRGLNHWVCYK